MALSQFLLILYFMLRKVVIVVKLKIIFYISQLIIIALFFSGCGEKANIGKKEINFAVTGEKVLYDYDESFMNGIQMAIEDSNMLYADKDFKITMELYDDEGIYEKGIVISHDIAENSSVTAVLGSQSFYIINSAAEIFENAGKILITPFSAYDETMDEGYKYLFRNTYGAYDLGASLAEYAVEKGYRKVAVCSKGTEYEVALLKGFYRESINSDLRIVDYYTNTNTHNELLAVFDRWEALGVDCVAIFMYQEEDSFNMLKAIRRKNPEMPILGDMAFDIRGLLAEHREFSDNIVIAGPLYIEPGEQNSEFKDRYLQKYQYKPTDYAIHGYDSIKMIVDTAVRINSTDPSLIARELHNKGFEGISGTIMFDEMGRLVAGIPKLLISKDGVFQEEDYE